MKSTVPLLSCFWISMWIEMDNWMQYRGCGRTAVNIEQKRIEKQKPIRSELWN